MTQFTVARTQVVVDHGVATSQVRIVATLGVVEFVLTSDRPVGVDFRALAKLFLCQRSGQQPGRPVRRADRVRRYQDLLLASQWPVSTTR